MKGFERTLGCGQIDKSFIGKEVSVCGWVNRRRDHGGLIFVDLRDRSGIVQLVFNPEISNDAFNDADNLRSEFVICAKGQIVLREQDAVNTDMKTGELELRASELKILNKSETLPFILDEAGDVDEELRLKYRYLDLRRKEMQKKLIMRNDIIFAMREFFAKEGFCEVETPILTKNTPEGSREYLVPSRIQKGHMYALPQSPQLYKQLLMAAGMEKYFPEIRSKVTGYDIQRNIEAFPVFTPDYYQILKILNEDNSTLGPLFLTGDYLVYPSFEGIYRLSITVLKRTVISSTLPTPSTPKYLF